MKNEIKNGVLIGYLNVIFTAIVTFIYTPIMIKLIGQSEYGLYSLVASIIAYLSVLDMGFGNAMIRYISKSQAEKNKNEESKLNGMFLLMYLLIGIIALIIGFIFLFNVDNLFSAKLTELELSKSKILLIISLVTVVLSFPLSIFDSYAMASEKFTFLKLLNMLKTVLIPLTTLPFLLFGFKSIAMVLIMSIYNITYHLCNMFLCFKKLNMKIAFDFNFRKSKLMKEILFYSFFVFLNIVVDNIYNNTDQIILGSVCGTAAVSVYAVAITISQANQLCSVTISSLFLPKITKLFAKGNNDKKISDLFIFVSRMQIYLMLLILTSFILFGQSFINLWVGNDYKDAYFIILLLIGPGFIPLTQNVAISILQAKNKHQFRSILYIFIAILNIMISIPLAKLYGGIGAAIGTAFGNLLGQIIIMNIYYYKVINLDIPRYWRFLIKILIPFIIIVPALYYLIHLITINSWIILFILALIYIIIYFFIIRLYFNEEENKYYYSIKTKLLRGDK